MDPHDALLDASAVTGWDLDSQLVIALAYIRNQQDDAAFAAFVQQAVAEEQALKTPTKP